MYGTYRLFEPAHLILQTLVGSPQLFQLLRLPFPVFFQVIRFLKTQKNSVRSGKTAARTLTAWQIE
jgi:hypothetical protein